MRSTPTTTANASTRSSTRKSEQLIPPSHRFVLDEESLAAHRFVFRSLLAVCAHPDDESFGLGALLSTFIDLGIRASLLCFTHGEASTLGMTNSELAGRRTDEVTEAAAVLGLSGFRLLSYPDGGLCDIALEELSRDIENSIAVEATDCVLVFDEGGITGHPDHKRATEAALVTAQRLGVAVLAWALPSSVATTLNDEFETAFVGRDASEIDFVIEVDRRRQRDAISCHGSQTSDNPVLWRRLALQADTEWLRWLTTAYGAAG